MTAVSIQGVGRAPNPRADHDDDWAWFWFCNDCGAESRRTSRERAETWAPKHLCGPSAESLHPKVYVQGSNVQEVLAIKRANMRRRGLTE